MQKHTVSPVRYTEKSESLKHVAGNAHFMHKYHNKPEFDESFIKIE
jgi:hypothetical protein